MAMPDAARIRPWINSGFQTLETIVRALVFALAVMPCTVAAVAPIWLAPALIEVWIALLHLSELERRAFYGGALATAISIVGLKYVVPLLVALAWLKGTRVGFTAPAIWAVAVMASFVIVARGIGSLIPQLDQLDGPAIAAIALSTTFCGDSRDVLRALRGNPDRGRDARYRAPPAQIPAGAIHAPGSHLG